jgi:thiol:disulfide interchange protein DsbD
MMIRTFLLLLLGASVAVRASGPIEATDGGASALVSQPHVTAELIPEVTTVDPGQPFEVALHLHSDPGWHTYWINPGDAGLATTITWTLPPGFTAGPIQWPTPEKHNMGPLVTYGYAGDVYLLTTITPPKSGLPRHFDVKAHTTWLVCKEECIPGKADLTVTLDSGSLNLRLPVDNSDFFNEAKARLPVENTVWNVNAFYEGTKLEVDLYLIKPDAKVGSTVTGYFFPEQPNVLATKENGSQLDYLSKGGSFGTDFDLQQNGEKPGEMSGVLVSDSPFVGNSKAIYLSTFHVDPTRPSNSTVPGDPSLSGTPPPPGRDLSPSAATSEGGADGGHRPPLQTAPPLGTAAATLLAVLGFAFLGGLILNLMPCVLPVLSLKVFSLMKHAGDNPKAAWIQGAAFTAGVVVSFWALAGVLLFLQAAGSHLGWGFQMQSPGFVLALIFLFFLLGLNLLGVFELGTSLVGLDARAAGRFHGTVSSFLNGALATVAATPCTAPFMGSSVGFAAQQPPFIALLVFTFLALGMASPYLLLTLFPGALRFVPKPGAWMEAFRQFMGFLLMATVIFLIYVFGALVGEKQVPDLLAALLLASVAAWIYGRWGVPMRSGLTRLTACVLALAILVYALDWGATLAKATPPPVVSNVGGQGSDGWQPWSPQAVHAALAQGRPVFVDFTAAWCLSCKVNERVALDTDAVKQAFTEKNVALFQADWTHPNTDIANELQKYNRDGVPLYLLYSPKNEDAPQVLPEVLTPGIVLEAVGNL